MAPQEYYKRALVFERPGMKPAERRLHAALGLGSELLEFDRAKETNDTTNIDEELGDLMWFAALAVDATGNLTYPPDGLVDNNVIYLIGDFITEVKREFAYGRGDLVRMNELANQIFYSVAFDIGNGSDIDRLIHVLTGNLRKLHQRYKAGKFTVDEALHRDTLAEIEAMLSTD